MFLKSKHFSRALPGVGQWIGHCPANQNVICSIPSQGPCLGCRSDFILGACKRQPIDVSLAHHCFSHSLTPSL